MTSFEESGSLFDSHFDNPAEDPDLNDNHQQAQRAESWESIRIPGTSEEIAEMQESTVISQRTRIDRAFNPNAKPNKVNYIS